MTLSSHSARAWFLGILCTLGVTTVLSAQEAERRWVYTEPTSSVPAVVALGDRGGQVFSTTEGSFGGRARLHSAYDVDPASHIWQSVYPGAVRNARVASSSQSDLHALLHMLPSPNGNGKHIAVVRGFRSASQEVWQWTFPSDFWIHEMAGLHVVPDGSQVIAALYMSQGDHAHVVRLNGHTGALQAEGFVPTFGGFNHTLLSADSSTLYIASAFRSTLVSVAQPWSYASRMTFMQTTPAHAVSRDGSRFYVAGENTLKGWEKVGTTFTQFLEVAIDGPGYFPQRLALSADDSTLVAGFIRSSNVRDLRVLAWDTATGTKRNDHVLVGGGTYSNKMTGLAVSANGTRFAMGNWGDQAGLLPQVVLFKKGEATPYAQFGLPGSAMGLDLSPDGRWLAVARKSVHANVSGSGGAIEVFGTSPSDLRVTGIPSLSAGSIHVSFRAATGPYVRVLWNYGLESQPLTFDAGTLYVRRNGLRMRPLTPEGGGWSGTDFLLATMPGMAVGQTLCLQGFSTEPRRLGIDFASVTILP